MSFDEELRIPMGLRSMKSEGAARAELAKYAPTQETAEEHLIEIRTELMAGVLDTFEKRNKAGEFQFNKIATSILDRNYYAEPCRFYQPRGKAVPWEEMSNDKKKEKLARVLRATVTDEKSFVHTENYDNKVGGQPSGRSEWIDFLLYTHAFDPQTSLTAPEDRLKRFNDMLSALGYSDLYLFDTSDLPVMAALILDLPYSEYRSLVLGEMGELLQTYKTEADSREKERCRATVNSDHHITVADAVDLHPYTGPTEDTWLLRITDVGTPSDDAFDPSSTEKDLPEAITAFEFIRTFASEFGRARRTVYRVFVSVFGNYTAEILDMLEADTEKDLAGDLLEIFKPSDGWNDTDESTDKRRFLAGMLRPNTDAHSRFLLLYSVLRQRYCNEEYHDVTSFKWTEKITKERLSYPNLSSLIDNMGQDKFNSMEPEEQERYILSLVPPELFEKTGETIPPSPEDGKAFARDKKDGAAPTSFRFSQKMATHEISMNRTALLTTFLLALSDNQIAEILDGIMNEETKQKLSPKKVKTIGDAVKGAINEILRACDMPVLRAELSIQDYLLLCAIYNIDYTSTLDALALLPKKDPASETQYPYREFCVSYYSEDQSGSQGATNAPQTTQ